MTVRKHLAILGFHKIGPPPRGQARTRYYIPEHVFVAQLRHLARQGWEVIDFRRCLRGLADPDTLPAKAALLTFDDGYRSLRRTTLPILQRQGLPGVLFMSTDFIGGRNTFDAGIEPDEEMCDWDDLRALERAGVAVQSHGASHRPYSRLGPAELAEDLRRSKQVLEEGLDRPVLLLAYPYGAVGTDPALVAQVEHAGYLAACGYGGGPNPLPPVTPYLLTRLAMGPDLDELRRELR